jgi:hypothetical protein
VGFDPRSALPFRWSLKPQDTVGLVFWTKDPTNLIFEKDLFRDYRVKIHVTATGWEEVEKGAPNLEECARLVAMTASVWGPENITWRFSPVPVVPNVVDRFGRIAALASHYGITSVYLAFLQENDRIPETRSEQDRLNVLSQVSEVALQYGIQVRLCNEDRLLARYPDYHTNLVSGICAPPEDFSLPGSRKAPSEGCGCALMVDPFTINESCTYGCEYCYASDKTLSHKKRNTTRSLPVIR